MIVQEKAASNPEAFAIHELRYIFENTKTEIRTLELQIEFEHRKLR